MDKKQYFELIDWSYVSQHIFDMKEMKSISEKYTRLLENLDFPWDLRAL